ncbi:MAG: homocysteine S-methyltransferase family protein [Gemmatimonadaceae bacterium]|nr:homocysteine S-methyltransferase family protein [Gemmatimonadaceae bacterium]
MSSLRMSYTSIADKLRCHDIIILDGGTGTDIQRRGAPMSGDTWCADANLTHPDIVRTVHRDYIHAGADIITANTFATSPILFSHIGRFSDVAHIDAIAVSLAREATVGTEVCVAGSMSTMRPMAAGTDRNNLNFVLSEHDARALFQAKANGLRASGCDLIMMELMRDTDYAVWASEAALATELPLWIGLSAERGKDGTLQGWGRDDCDFDDIARTLAALTPEVMMVMHTSPNNTDEALTILRKHWTGPIATYPECGYFKSPDWEFIDVISPDELVRKSHDWQQLGASIFGGCCGIGPDHIAALTSEFKTPRIRSITTSGPSARA